MVAVRQPTGLEHLTETMGPQKVLGNASFWVPLEVEKPTGAPAKPKMVMRGIATTDHRDLQGEVVDQDGLDWSYFLKYGWINDIHDKGAGAGVGYPLGVQRIKTRDGHDGHAIRFELLPSPEGKRIWNMATALDDAQAPRELGLSVQGPILKREGPNGERLAKLLVMDVTVSRHQVNKHATATVEKSFDGALRAIAVAQKSLDAGAPAPTYEGGGTAAPLLAQDHDRRPRRKGERKMKREEFSKMFPGASEDALKAAAKALGVEWDDEGADGYAEKSLEVYDSVDEAMKSIEAHIAAGGEVILAEPGQVEADTTGALRTVGDALAGTFREVNKSLDVQANGVAAALDAIQFQGEALKSLEARFASLDESIRTALRMPVQPKAARPGVPLVDPSRGEARQPTDAVPYGEARKSLETAFEAATAKGDKASMERISNLMLAVDGGYSVTRADMASAGLTN